MKLEVVPLPMNGDYVLVISEVAMDDLDADSLQRFKSDAGARALLATSEPVEVVR